MGIEEQVEKYGLGEFDLKLFRLETIEGKAENCAIVAKAQLENGAAFFAGKCNK